MKGIPNVSQFDTKKATKADKQESPQTTDEMLVNPAGEHTNPTSEFVGKLLAYAVTTAVHEIVGLINSVLDDDGVREVKFTFRNSGKELTFTVSENGKIDTHIT